MADSAEEKRYFENHADKICPFEDSGGMTKEKNPGSNNLKKLLKDYCEAVFRSSRHECRGGLYVGAAGAAYSYVHVCKFLEHEEKKRYGSEAKLLLEKHLQYFETTGASVKSAPGFLHGAPGVYSVAAVFGKLIGDEDMEKRGTENYVKAARFYRKITEFGMDELFLGRAGYLLGALWMQEQLGYSPVPEKDLEDIWRATLRSGRHYAQRSKSPCPLMYSYHQKEYLGAAHGLCAILQVLLSFPNFMKNDASAASDIQNTVDFYLTLRDPEGNYPSSTGKTGIAKLVHWCHGAPGAIYMFAKAYMVFRDEKYLRACVDCGDLIWRKGLLKKGPGICHGIAGNGYAFLLLKKLLNEDTKGLNYYRALKFAEFLTSSEFQAKARTPDRPYSLYEGLAGTVCFLSDLLFSPTSGGFPFFNVFYDFKHEKL